MSSDEDAEVLNMSTDESEEEPSAPATPAPCLGRALSRSKAPRSCALLLRAPGRIAAIPYYLVLLDYKLQTSLQVLSLYLIIQILFISLEA